jgi:hypothetical protein
MFDGLDDPWMAEADLMDIVAMKIKISATFNVLNPGSLRRLQNVQARRREGLMEEIAGILNQHGFRLRPDMLPRPRLSTGGQVDISFGT